MKSRNEKKQNKTKFNAVTDLKCSLVTVGSATSTLH